MRQIVLMSSPEGDVILQTGPDPNHVKLILKVLSRTSGWMFYTFDLDIKNLANAILEVQHES